MKRRKALSLLLALVFAVSLSSVMGGTARASDELQNVKLSPEGVLTWDAYPEADFYYYTVERLDGEKLDPWPIEREKAATSSTGTETLNLIEFCREMGYPRGTYSIAIYASRRNPNGGHMMIPLTSEWKGTFTYDPPKTLSTPQNLRWDGPVARWDAVEGAKKYIVCLYTNETTLDAEKHVMAPKLYQDFSNRGVTAGSKMFFTVQAISEGQDTLASEIARSESPTEPIIENPTYTVTVDGGTVDKPNAEYLWKVTITADEPPAGQVFDHWEVVSGDVFITYDQETTPTASFTMPDENVRIKAVFKSADPLQFIGSLKLEPSDGKVANGGEFKVSFQLNRPAEEIYIEYQNEYGNWIECGILGNEDPVQSGTKTYSSDQWQDCTVSFRLRASNDGEDGTSDPFTVTFGSAAKTTHWNVTPSLTVYESADIDSKYIGTVPQGAEVTVLETQGDRSKIIYKDGYGWVYSQFLLPIGEKLNPFVDVSKDDQWYDAVLWAYYAEPQVTNGVDATHFGPEKTVTRGQCAAFLWRAMGEPEPTNTKNPFVDVPSSQYYYKPILWAVEKGITKGTDATHFSPNSTLSTRHIITFLYRAKNPGMDGWGDGKAETWAGQDYGGKPFGVEINVSNTTDCPRGYVVMFLQKAK